MSFNESVDKIVAEDESGLLGVSPNWGRVRLGDVCAILNGFPFSSKHFRPSGGTPLIRIRDVVRGRTETHFVGEFESEFLVSPGQLLVGMDGDFNCALWAGEEALLNQRVCKVTPDERYYDLRLLVYALPGYLSAINARTSAITVKHLSSKTVAELPLPLPPRKEQLRLVEAIESYFSRLDDAVASLERVQRNLQRYRASVLKAAVDGRLVPNEAELARAEGRDYEPAAVLLERILAERRRRWESAELLRMSARGRLPKDDRWKARYPEPAEPDTAGLPELPSGWCWASVDQVADGQQDNALCDGPFGSNLKSSHYTESGPQVIRLQNVGDGVFKEAPAHVSREHFERLKKHAVQASDLVVASLGQDLPRACLVPAWLGEAMVKADCLRLAVDQRAVLPVFAMHALNSPRTRKIAETLVHGVGRPRIGLTLFRSFPLPLPPISEQVRIVEAVERLQSTELALLETAGNEMRRLGVLRQSVLKWAFEGRLADKDVNDEPADALLQRILAERMNAATNRPRDLGRKKAPAKKS